MSLLNLALDILEELLYLPEVIQGKAQIHERLLRPLTRELNWRVQRRLWGRIKKCHFESITENKFVIGLLQ